MLFAPSGKRRNRQKKGEKGRFWLISRKGSQTPLKPQFVTPPYLRQPLFRGLESCRPGIDPIRASGPKWGRKWPKNAFLASPEKWGTHGLENGEKWAEIPFSKHFRAISQAIFLIFRPFFPIFQMRPKSIFSAIFVPISGQRSETDLYQVYGIPIRGSEQISRRAKWG